MIPLHITAFLDGRPGHEKQTQGVVAALSRLTPVEAKFVKLASPSVKTGLKNWMVYLVTLGLRIAQRSTEEPVDLIIGTGASTHVPMLQFKGRSRSKVVTCMTPDPVLLRKIDLCLVPHHDQPSERDNIFVTVGPPGLPPQKRQSDSRSNLILVGGRDEKSHVWRTSELIVQIEMLLKRQADIKWTITSSPRTPNDCENRLQAVADLHANVSFFRAQDTQTGWVEAAYAENAMAWVTADSISMIYEALTAGCRVGILPVKWKQANNKFQRSIDYLAHQELIMTYAQWLENPTHSVRPAALDEASRCAEEILKRWWPDRLP